MRVPFPSGFLYATGGALVPPVFGRDSGLIAVEAGADIGQVPIVEEGVELTPISIVEEGVPAPN